jgi:hypothetical protein
MDSRVGDGLRIEEGFDEQTHGCKEITQLIDDIR